MRCSVLLAIAALALPFAAAVAAAPVFTPGNLVVSVEGNGVFGATSGPYGDNQASPMTLFQYTPSGTSAAAYAGSLVLPQAASGGNYAFSAEYGSSSEGLLHLSGNGAYLTVAGYGINAATFNANPALYGTGINDPSKPTALAQSGSLTGQGYIPVPRVIALIDANGVVDTTTALFDVFNGNNPRSVYSVDGSAFYVPGQGHSPDATGGVVYAAKGATTATPVSGNDTSGKTASQDTRDVQVYNGQLYVSTDSKEGSGSNRDFVGTLGTAAALPTGLANNGNGPAMLPGFGNSGGTGKLVITAATSNGVNAAAQEINLSPESFFFANATTLYVADSGLPKNDSALNDSNGSRLGDGGLQKWVLSGGRWSLAYTLSAGLGLVANTATAGVTGLLGLTGQVTDGSVKLYATSYTIGDTDQSYLYGITDLLAATSRPSGETFATLAAAPADSTFKGVAFAPIASATAVPGPSSWAMTIVGIGLAGCVSGAGGPVPCSAPRDPGGVAAIGPNMPGRRPLITTETSDRVQETPCGRRSRGERDFTVSFMIQSSETRSRETVIVMQPRRDMSHHPSSGLADTSAAATVLGSNASARSWAGEVTPWPATSTAAGRPSCARL